MKSKKKIGVLLINLGTPDAPTVKAVRSYLKQFLSDPLVIDSPAWIRFLLLYLVILPLRPAKTSKAYQEIWTPDGSPLLVCSQDLCQALSANLGEEYHVELAMRYGSPAIEQAVSSLKKQACTEWLVVPLYPQYARSTTESCWRELNRIIAMIYEGRSEPTLHDLKAFYKHPLYIKALAGVTAESLASVKVDHVLMSFHGLPVRHLTPPVCTERTCDRLKGECPRSSSSEPSCYRAQCFETARHCADHLSLSDERYTVSFQSRLGRIPWIGPDTESVIDDLYEKGVRHLAVMMPAFVADCLETLEEIGLQLRKSWLEKSGTTFHLVPCLNAHPLWVKALSELVLALLPVKIV